ncbi:MAG: helix-turn-helix domain-containing protein [Schwartzia succinivorans]|nr:helix-turn-helix domain-containing protein [Schwartzia succinivorans]
MRNELLEQRNFVTPKELSEIFDKQISVTTINVLIRQGKIPCSKMGRKNLIPVTFAREQINKGLHN